MTTKTGRMKLGKGTLTIDGAPITEITDLRLPSKGPAFLTHCLRRKQRRSIPHATFRHFAMNGTSYNVLLPHLEHQDVLRARAYMAAVAENAANLAGSFQKATQATKALGEALNSVKEV